MSTHQSAYSIIRQRLSAARMAPYESAAGGDLSRAFALYEWNMEVSASLFHSIGMLEVVLRNALHQELSAAAPLPWYQHIHLDPKATDDIRTAVRRATERGTKPEIPDKVVAELSFGFWRFLLTRRNHTTLWVPHLHRAFPHHPNAVRNRLDIEKRVEHLHFVRNRVAHHEPVHRRTLADDYQELLEVCGWICPDTQSWISHCSTVSATLQHKP